MDAIDRFGDSLVRAARVRGGLRRGFTARLPFRYAHADRPGGPVPRLRVLLIVLVLMLVFAAIGLAASGVILTGTPVQPVIHPQASAGEGLPVEGGSRLLALRVADPAGGPPWGMRIVHTTRGLVCVQIGRVYHGRLGDLGIDGAFGDDGRFHALTADAMPDLLGGFQGLMSGQCAAPGATDSSQIVGLEASAAGNPPAGKGVAAGRREISFGLLGSHARSITYRSGSTLHTSKVLPGLGAYMIVQRYSSGRPLASFSESLGRDEPGNYSSPASPDGALTSITYSYAGKRCVDDGRLRAASCGLSEVPAPSPAKLPVVHEPVRVRLLLHRRLITGANISFHAPYPVTSALQNYTTIAHGCEWFSASGPNADVARGATVTIAIGPRLAPSKACPRAFTITVYYVRMIRGLPEPTVVGTVTVREPPGTRPEPALRPPARL